MDNLAKHIEQASRDVTEVNTSARKISGRFQKIERLELGDEEQRKLLLLADGEDDSEEKDQI
jgi:DNA recombination protein RmuC